MSDYSRTITDEAGRPLRIQGVLLKKGGSKGGKSIRSSFTRRNWQSRYFALDVEHGALRYYEDANHKKLKGGLRFTAARRRGNRVRLLAALPRRAPRHGRRPSSRAILSSTCGVGANT